MIAEPNEEAIPESQVQDDLTGITTFNIIATGFDF